MKKNLWTLGAALAMSGAAHAEIGVACQTDAECGKGEACLLTPCPAIACDPDDANCVQPECPTNGVCGAIPDSQPSLSACATDADCGDGYLCQVVGQSAGAGCACPSDVPPDACDCPPPAPAEDIWGCVPKPCAVDADCGDGQQCVTIDLGCATDMPTFAPCAEGEECKPAPTEPVECVSSTTTQCQYAWEGTCEADADCGAGFLCKASEMCTCSGGGSTPAADGSGDAGFAPPPAEPTEECVCEPTGGPKYCELQEIACDTDADCPAGLFCGTGAGPVMDGGVSCTDTDGDGNCDESAKMACFDENGDGECDGSGGATEVPKTCGYAWKAGGPFPATPEGGGESTAGEPGTDTSGDGTLPPEATQNGLPTAPSEAETDGDSAGAATDNSASDGPSSGNATGGASAGCTTTGGAAPGFASLLGLALFGLFLRRK